MPVSFANVLIVGSKRLGALELAYARAFGRLGLESVDHFDLEGPGATLLRNRIIGRLTQRLQSEVTGKALLAYLQTHKQKYEAIIVFKGMALTPSWITRCQAVTHPALWVNVNPDDPFNLGSRGATNVDVVNSICHYDVYATWGKHLVPAIQRQGCPAVLYLPFAYDADHHFAVNNGMQQGDYFTFVGGWDQDRERVLSEIGDFPLKIHGEGWHRIRNRSPLTGKIQPTNIYGEELRRVISQAKAAINVLRPQNYTSHNMRTFEIPAMRGLMVTNRSTEQEQFFPEGRASLMFADAKELRSKLTWVMEGRDLEHMKETGLKLCQGQSYDDRARTLHDEIAIHWKKRIAA